MTIQNLIGDYEAFLREILRSISSEGFDLSDFIQIDHLCYRTSSLDNYYKKKSELGQISSLLGENIVNGRPISVFRFNQPIIHDKWRIDALELPAPKEGKSFNEGLEHIEFVIYDDIPTFLKKYKGKVFDMRAADRGINPEIGYQLPKYSVKFHILSLPVVVFLENKLEIKDIKDSQ